MKKRNSLKILSCQKVCKNKGISKCEDLTPTQRREEELADEVKEKNGSGSNVTYRVRGSAKNR